MKLFVSVLEAIFVVIGVLAVLVVALARFGIIGVFHGPRPGPRGD